MLEQLVNTVESGLADLGRRVCAPSRRERLEDEIERLSTELRGSQTDLERLRSELIALKRRIHENPSVAALLHSRIEAALSERRPDQAWQHALELDRLRQGMVADQETRPRLEQVCWSLAFHVRQLERRLARLQKQLDPR
jgi:predicted  nucleic acid-binding Zn-ribbon protein